MTHAIDRTKTGQGVGEPKVQPPLLADRDDVGAELLSVEHLTTSFFTNDGVVPAVRDVSFTVRRGEILGLVGESGSGKSATARSIIGLVPRPGRTTDGRIMFKDRDLRGLSAKQWRTVRGAEMSIVLQEPMSSLNPVLRIGDQVAEMFETHAHKAPPGMSTREAAEQVLRKVRIPRADERSRDYPMHFSGGMRQRVSIAMAVACQPDLLIADEPTTALDVTVQAQILELLLELRDTFGMGMLLITHDLGVVAQICDSVAVMYAGEIVEYSDVHSLFESPQHPYTKALLRSLPTLDERMEILPSITGTPMDLREVGSFCPFVERCEVAFGRCREAAPELWRVPTDAQPAAHVRCWHQEPSP